MLQFEHRSKTFETIASPDRGQQERQPSSMLAQEGLQVETHPTLARSYCGSSAKRDKDFCNMPLSKELNAKVVAMQIYLDKWQK